MFWRELAPLEFLCFSCKQRGLQLDQTLSQSLFSKSISRCVFHIVISYLLLFICRSNPNKGLSDLQNKKNREIKTEIKAKQQYSCGKLMVSILIKIMFIVKGIFFRFKERQLLLLDNGIAVSSSGKPFLFYIYSFEAIKEWVWIPPVLRTSVPVEMPSAMNRWSNHTSAKKRPCVIKM